MGNDVKLTLCERIPGTGRIAVEITTDDFPQNGDNNKAGVHLWHGNETYDVVLDQYKGKAEDGISDKFAGTIDEAQLPPGIRAQLNTAAPDVGVTAFAKVPYQPDVWSNENYKVTERAKDRQLDAPELADPDRRLTRKTGTVQMAIGDLEVIGLAREMQGYKSQYGREYLVGLTLKPSAQLQSADPAEVTVWIAPKVEEVDYRYGSYGATRNVTKQFEDLKKQNTISLKKQADGTYAAQAAPGKCFIDVGENWLYMGGAASLKEWKLAAVYGAEQWDSRGGANYALAVDGPNVQRTPECYIDGVSVELISACADDVRRDFFAAACTGDVDKVTQSYAAICAAHPEATKTAEITHEFTDAVAKAINEPSTQVNSALVLYVLDLLKPNNAGGLYQAAIEANSVPLFATVIDWAAAKNQTEVYDNALGLLAYANADVAMVKDLLNNHTPSVTAMNDELKGSTTSYEVKEQLILFGKCDQSAHDEGLHMAAFLVDGPTVELMLTKGNCSPQGIQDAYDRLLTSDRGTAADKKPLIKMFLDAGAT